jgi:hypothetical protein
MLARKDGLRRRNLGRASSPQERLEAWRDAARAYLPASRSEKFLSAGTLFRHALSNGAAIAGAASLSLLDPA